MSPYDENVRSYESFARGSLESSPGANGSVEELPLTREEPEPPPRPPPPKQQTTPPPPGFAPRPLFGSLAPSRRAFSSSSAPPPMSHIDEKGKAAMVDVSEKADTKRTAVAEAPVELGDDAYAALDGAAGGGAKGDVFGVARLAGILGAKKTAELIPLCHPLLLSHVGVELTADPAARAVRIVATASTTGGTGVEMEALTGASVAALAVYDMCKAASKGIVIAHRPAFGLYVQNSMLSEAV